MTRFVAFVLGAACVLLAASPAHAEREIFTDDHGQTIERDGAITCVYYNSVHGACGRSLPLEPGQAWHMTPTHDCARPAETAPWSCQPRAGGGLTPEQQQALLQMLMKRRTGPPEPGPRVQSGCAAFRVSEPGRHVRPRNGGLLHAAASAPSPVPFGMDRLQPQHGV